MTLEDFLRTEAMKCSVKNAEQVERAWNAATAAERERCVKSLEVLPWEQAATAEEAIRAGEEPK